MICRSSGIGRGYVGLSRLFQEAASILRRRETPAEEVLWQALRSRKVSGLKFRRQHAVGPFILDFYCPERKLVVELDGNVHTSNDAREHDALRTEHVNRYGYHVLRFSNDQVFDQLPEVLATIAQAATCLPLSPPPLPKLGEGVGGEGGFEGGTTRRKP